MLVVRDKVGRPQVSFRVSNMGGATVLKVGGGTILREERAKKIF